MSLPGTPADLYPAVAEVGDSPLAVPTEGDQRMGDIRANERAALRRVSQLVARGPGREAVLDAIVTEAYRLFPVDFTALLAYVDDAGAASIVALHNGPSTLVIGDRAPHLEDGLVLRAFSCGCPVRVEAYAEMTGPDVGRMHELGVTSGGAAPIIVDGRIWGVLAAMTRSGSVPAGLELRLAEFADIAATAVATAQAKDELRELADEQAALRHVAELAAQGAQPNDFFQQLAVEASTLLHESPTLVSRFDGDGASIVVAASGGHVTVGPYNVSTSDNLANTVQRTGRAARIDDYTAVPGSAPGQDDDVRAAVAVPIRVDGVVWGILVVTSTDEPLPRDTERRLSQFAEIAAAATSSATARASLRRLADEQAALRRVAELVARGTGEDQLFAAVTREAAALMGDEATTLVRFVGERAFTVLATHLGPSTVGSTVEVPLDDKGLVAEILRTKKAARLDAYDASGRFYGQDFGVGSSVAVPIVVDDRMWGLLGVTTWHRLPADTDVRLQQFAELAAVAIANAENKAQLTASRARVVATADETRRRLQRDVHDGAQQRLVQTVINLKIARAAVTEGSTASAHVAEALFHAERASSELRDLVHGILPASLTQGGLQTGLESLISDVSIPVQLKLTAPPMPLAIETTAYFIVAEALTNVVKHARASHAEVSVTLVGTSLAIDVTDDGIGGADPSGGGLTGLADRVGAADGTLTVSSAVGHGTTVGAVLPLTVKRR